MNIDTVIQTVLVIIAVWAFYLAVQQAYRAILTARCIARRLRWRG